MTAPPPGPLRPGRSRDELVGEVARALHPLPAGAAAVCAVSGGPDSTALAHLVAAARDDLRLVLGHVRHGLRDDRDDLAAVHRLASRLDLPVRVAQVAVVPDGQGLEAAARARRYRALRRIAQDAGAGWLLVGHTADDQAETLLLRLARGTGVTGLGGMAPVRDGIVRPLLRVRRADVRRLVADAGLTVVDDPMNHDPARGRTHARHAVLPALERVAPDPVGALARLADLARADDRRLDAEAGALVAGARRYGPVCALPADVLDALDRALARRVVHRLLADVGGRRHPPGAAHVAAVLRLAGGAAHHAPGCVVSRGGGWVAFAPAGVTPPPPAAVAVPGTTPWGGTTITAGTEPARGVPPPAGGRPASVSALAPGGDPALARVVLRDGAGPLAVRARRPGDRIATRAGTRKLQDVLVDAGVPRVARDLVPVVTAGDQPVWIPGLAVDTGATAGAAGGGVVLTVAAPGDPHGSRAGRR